MGETLAALSASENPASEKFIKNMLLSLKRDMQLVLHTHLSKMSKLNPYIQLLKVLLPNGWAHNLIIDRAHRLFKPKHLPADTPRDVLTRINFFHIKERVRATVR